MIPVEVCIPLLRCETYDQEENHALQWYKLDMLEEKRDLTALRIASYQDCGTGFNSKVKERRFKEGDLVLQKVLPNTKEVNVRVLRPN